MTELPTQARIVVIGGGAMGCSTLYHLAALGIEDAVLLERHQPTSGTTWHSAAQVRQLRSTNNLTQLIKYSAELYARLEAETGQATGWRRTGSLSLATTSDRFTHIKRQASLAHTFGVEAEVVGPEEAKRLWPLIRTDDVIGAVFAPDDGRVNPSDLCAALLKGAKARGARVFEETEVTGIEVEAGRVRSVGTDRGRIACEIVVDCAGLWGRRVGAMAGVSVPLHACEHFYLLTKPIPGIEGHLPTLGDHDHYLYLRDDVGGLLVGCFEPKAKGIAVEDLPADFAFGMLNEDWDHFEPMMRHALKRVPALETAEVRMLLNGPESFTPDGGFLLGEAPEVGGFFVGCGMNSMGLASAGGAGKALAEWVVAGEPSMDLWSVDIRRFAPFQANPGFLAERIPEVLSLHYAIGYPGREPETGRDLRLGPLHDRLAGKNARFGERHGWERALYFGERAATLGYGRPAWFDQVASECPATREAAALFDQSSFAKLLLEGPDAEAFLQRVAANDVARPVGAIVYTGMLNDSGGYESDLPVFRLAEDRFLLVTGTGQGIRDASRLRRLIGEGERVVLSDITSGLAVLALMGPRSRDILARVSDADLSLEGFPLYSHREIAIGHAMVRAARLSYVGELGWELYVPVESAAGVYDRLMAAGAADGLEDAGLYAMASLRLEKGYRAWGHDLTPDDTPLEAGLEFAVAMGKSTPFIGREALLRQAEAGIGKRLVHVTIPDSSLHPLGDEPIVRDGRIVGQLRSAAFGHSLGHGVGIGYVSLDGVAAEAFVAEGGFEIELALERFPASLSLSPPFDPTGARMRL